MDITAQSFYYHLPRMLDDLSSCLFVSLDFEFSGIASASPGRSRGRQSLQQRYEEVKASAEKYQILQVGLTICHEDTQTATYHLKPYNLYLNPIIDRKLEVERNWSFQSSAVEFLLENKFSMDTLFRDGVPYLSREEEEQAISQAIQRGNRSTEHKVMDVKDTDYESLEFLRVVRQLVDAWLNSGPRRDHYLNIPPPSRQIEAQELRSMPSVLNRFQKRLVHQLIEVEYPLLVTIGKPTFVQIIEHDEARETAVQEQRVRWVRERAWRQTGFRWVAEAMTGGDISNLEPNCFTSVWAQSTGAERTASVQEFKDRLQERLKARRPILVGHNLFTDLVYFYRCFFGPLPDRVDLFQSLIRDLFPILVDTKYVATHNCGSINPRSSLQELHDSLLQTPYPLISIDPQHSKYRTQIIDHEAGADSLLTGIIFVKLSAKPRFTYKPIEISAESPGSTLKSYRFPRKGTTESRSDLRDIEETLENIKINGSHAAVRPSGARQIVIVEAVEDERRKASEGYLIPRPDSGFWEMFANKLRVFGTEERVCLIG